MRRSRSPNRAMPLALVFLACLPCAASASDGVIEINQAQAAQGSVNGSATADPPGFPVVITAPGSYVLTGDLVPLPGATGISIQSSDVSIDLNGFEIRGVNVCSGGFHTTVTCTAGGSPSKGIDSPSCDPRLRVRNGRVVGMLTGGVNLCGTESRIEGVSASHNGGNGLRVGAGGFIVDSTAVLNLLNGIDADDTTTIRDNVLDRNGGHGIRVNGNAIVSGNTSNANMGSGIFASSGGAEGSSTVTGNTTNANANDGIYMRGGVLANNTATGNSNCGMAGSGEPYGVAASGNTATNNPPGCGGLTSCCSIQDADFTSCNVVTAFFGVQRCCPVAGASVTDCQ